MVFEHKQQSIYTVTANSIQELSDAIGELPNTCELILTETWNLADGDGNITDELGIRLVYRDYP